MMAREKYYVYVLFSLKDHNLYTGFTADLKRRLSQHAHGEVAATSHRRPLKLIHYEYYVNEEDAKSREVFLKSGFGRNNLKKALRRTLNNSLLLKAQITSTEYIYDTCLPVKP